MTKDELTKLINQIKKYNLTKYFDSPQQFDKWLSKLSKKQIQNFNSLSIEPTTIMFSPKLLIDENLLNCNDYTKRIDAMLKLKNGDGCWHLFDALVSPNFLNSKNYYSDIEMISKADTARYALWVINEDSFIESKYHNEDLKYIIEAKDIKYDGEHQNDWLVSQALASVAENIDSIKSDYHQKDMELISKSGSQCLQTVNSYPEHSLNNLANNKVSLKDKYHLENMQILAKNPIASKYLYDIMTDPYFISGKNYREEINALVNAKSKITAMAIYNYIVAPEEYSHEFIMELYNNCSDFNYISLMTKNEQIKGNLNPKYLEHLQLLKQIDDEYVIFVQLLMSNKKLFNSEYQEYDLNLLISIKDKEILMDLYKLMTNEVSLSTIHHMKDVELISKTENKEIRALLLDKATNVCSVNSNNHEYDMQYIAKLDLNNIDIERYKKIHHFLFDQNGINHIDHVDILERLYNGENVEYGDLILNHLYNIEQNLNEIIIPKVKRYRKFRIFKKNEK